MLSTGRTVFAALGATLALPALTALTATAAAADPAPEGVAVEIATINGTGCSSGSTGISFWGGEHLTIERQDVRVEVGGTNDSTNSTKNCQVSLRVHAPQTHSYAIKRASAYKGDAHLEPGASSTLTSHAFLQGTPDRPITYTLHGPFSGAWQFQPPDSDPVFKPCGEQRMYTISTQLQADIGTSDKSKTSYMTMDGKEAYQFLWKKCPAS